jgi:FkbM family methyltransferase
MFSVLQRFGWSPKNVLDIGGFKGNWTRQVRNMFPSAGFVIVEPNPHKELESVGAPVHYEVLSSEIKSVPWYSNMSTGDSLYKEKTLHYESVQGVIRNTTTLDTLFPDTVFDCVKIDCQGAELDILKGGQRMIAHTDVVLLECSFAGQYNAGAPSFLEYISALDSLGFAPLDITELHRAGTILCQIDILFLRKSSPLWTQIQQKMTH